MSRMFLLLFVLKILKWFATVKTLLGFDDYPNFKNEKRGLTIPEQLSLLAERIYNVTKSIQREPIPESESILTTKTEIRAHLLVEHLKHNVPEIYGIKFLTAKEIVHFLQYEIDELYLVSEGQNVRKTKKEVLAKAVKLFPDNVFLSQK